MKLIFSEYPADYSKYQFPYQVMAVREKKDNLAQIYYNGWLPFRSKKDLYYLTRSTRVRMSKFSPSSENRRILKKTDWLSYTIRPIEHFTFTPEIQKFCKQYADKTFGKGVIPTAAIRKLFTNANTTHVMTFIGQQENVPAGYAAAVVHEHFLHYAHPFCDLNIDDKDIGMGMMLRAITWAQEQHKQFTYLGTCYTKNSLYKTQFSGFEFFNGWQWSDNKDELKYLVDRKSNNYTFQDSDYLKRFLKEDWTKEIEQSITRVTLK